MLYQSAHVSLGVRCSSSKSVRRVAHCVRISSGSVPGAAASCWRFSSSRGSVSCSRFRSPRPNSRANPCLAPSHALVVAAATTVPGECHQLKQALHQHPSAPLAHLQPNDRTAQLTAPLRFSQQLSADHLVLELREDERGLDDVADRGRADRFPESAGDLHATRSYSWISPPRILWRRIRAAAARRPPGAAPAVRRPSTPKNAPAAPFSRPGAGTPDRSSVPSRTSDPARHGCSPSANQQVSRLRAVLEPHRAATRLRKVAATGTGWDHV